MEPAQTIREITREEVAKHNTYEDQWIIVNDSVYDVTKFYKRHPGGKVICFFKGEDATEAVYAFHPDMKKTEKYMKPLLVGKLSSKSYEAADPVVKDFRALRADFVKEGMFRPNYLWYALVLLHIFALEALGLALMYYWGSSRWAFWATAIVLAVSQIQAGWLQHDFGHLSVMFENRWWNNAFHHFIIGGLKGASSNWWKSRHNRHHAKTNVLSRDPDIHTEPIFVWSNEMAKRVHYRILSYQPLYWWLFGPPAVTTLLFVYQNLHFVLTQKMWVDFCWTFFFFFKYFYTYTRVMSGWDAFLLYATMRFIESHWFTWVTSMNHLPRDMTVDVGNNWIYTHLSSTQNVTEGPFHNWFTGHLNFQIEHHLFPTMPRHNYTLIAPRIKALCEKHGLKYRVRSMGEACQDILDKLKNVSTHIGKQYYSQKKAQ